jgi:hypothetical protein
MKAEVNRSSEDYEAHLGRFLQLKRSSDEAQVLTVTTSTVTNSYKVDRSPAVAHQLSVLQQS